MCVVGGWWVARGVVLYRPKGSRLFFKMAAVSYLETEREKERGRRVSV